MTLVLSYQRNQAKIPYRGVFVHDPCDPWSANRIEGLCHVGLGHRVTWGVGGRGWYCSGEVGCTIDSYGGDRKKGGNFGVTSEVRANPQLSSGCDASAYSTAEADPRLYAPRDFVPQHQGMNKRTKNTSYDHLSAGTDPHVLADKTKYVEEEEASSTIKLEDLAKLVLHVQPSFKDLDSLKDDHVIVVDDSNKDEETEKDEVHPTPNVETKDTLVPKSSSPRPLSKHDPLDRLNDLENKKRKHVVDIHDIFKAKKSLKS
nr:hypothetical protein [Tanacetum cinerariifolium]